MDAQPTMPQGPNSNSNPNMMPGGMQPEQVVARPELVPQPATPETGPAVPQGTPPQVAASAPVVDPMALAMAQPMPASSGPAQPPLSTPMPNLAADVDVIEPEWVAKAEETVRQHMGDPYGEEEAVEQLQEEYLQKRYGLTVHEPGEDTTNTESI